MNGKPYGSQTRRCRRWVPAAVVVALCWTNGAGAQAVAEPGKFSLSNLTLSTPMPAPEAANAPAKDAPIKDANVVPAGCSTCANGLFGGGGGGGGCSGCGGGSNCDPKGCCGCASGCGPCGVGQCVPGRTNCCSLCDSNTVVGRMLCGLYCCICCPDPCYEGCFVPAANAAFFVDPVRPVTQMRIRWDSVLNYTLPDRSEFFMAKLGVVTPGVLVDTKAKGKDAIPGKGPSPPGGNALVLTSLKYNDFMLYQEVAAGKASFFVELPYRSLDPAEPYDHAAGFADMNLGFKSLFFDCELLQLAFQFRTYLPIGNYNRGIGNGHVSLEPSLLGSLKLTRDTYLQAQIAEWIPLGGDPDYAGAILHWGISANQVLWRVLPDVPLIGTLELSGYSFQDGAYTDATLGPWQKSSGTTYLSLGPGLRMVVCNKIDFGVGTAFAVNQHGPGQWYRTEFRWRF